MTACQQARVGRNTQRALRQMGQLDIRRNALPLLRSMNVRFREARMSVKGAKQLLL